MIYIKNIHTSKVEFDCALQQAQCFCCKFASIAGIQSGKKVAFSAFYVMTLGEEGAGRA